MPGQLRIEDKVEILKAAAQLAVGVAPTRDRPRTLENILQDFETAANKAVERFENISWESFERDVNCSELYVAEVAYFCGTEWEVTPITSIDGLPVGDGEVGPITKRLQDRYFDIVHGRVPDDRGWLTPVC